MPAKYRAYQLKDDPKYWAVSDGVGGEALFHDSRYPNAYYPNARQAAEAFAENQNSKLAMMSQLPDETPELAAAVPAHLLESLRGYALDRRVLGGFLMAVLRNDFHGAIMRADAESLACIRAIALYVANALPSACWGSDDKVKAWLKMGPGPEPEGSNE